MEVMELPKSPSFKDPVEEFEMLDKSLNEAMGSFLRGFGNMFGGNKASTGAPTTTAGIIQKHRQSVESGDECEAFGTNPHGLFYSTLGAPDAYFGKKRNHVKNIMDFSISKRELRCYDIKKDPKGIAWLFKSDAKFEADKIWGGPRKLYFTGTWYSGTFNGIWVGEWSNFKGGDFKGTYLKGQEPFQPPAQRGVINVPRLPYIIRNVPREGLQTIKKIVQECLKGQK